MVTNVNVIPLRGFTVLIFRTCTRVEQEVLSPEEMVEIEKELRQRKELLELKCRQLEHYLPEPKKDVSYLRSPSEMLIWVSFWYITNWRTQNIMGSGGKDVKYF